MVHFYFHSVSFICSFIQSVTLNKSESYCIQSVLLQDQNNYTATVSFVLPEVPVHTLNIYFLFSHPRNHCYPLSWTKEPAPYPIYGVSKHIPTSNSQSPCLHNISVTHISTCSHCHCLTGRSPSSLWISAALPQLTSQLSTLPHLMWAVSRLYCMPTTSPLTQHMIFLLILQRNCKPSDKNSFPKITNTPVHTSIFALLCCDNG